MHIAEVGVFDANATALEVQTRDLMEAAGQAVASEAARIAESLEGAEHREIWILCGPGNNGGQYSWDHSDHSLLIMLLRNAT